MRFIVSALSDCGGSVSVEKPTARAGALPGSGRGTGVRCRSGAEMIVLLLLEMGILRQACTQPTSVAPLRVSTLVRVSTPALRHAAHPVPPVKSLAVFFHRPSVRSSGPARRELLPPVHWPGRLSGTPRSSGIYSRAAPRCRFGIQCNTAPQCAVPIECATVAYFRAGFRAGHAAARPVVALRLHVRILVHRVATQSRMVATQRGTAATTPAEPLRFETRRRVARSCALAPVTRRGTADVRLVRCACGRRAFVRAPADCGAGRCARLISVM
jgi:hypothetical protein